MPEEPSPMITRPTGKLLERPAVEVARALLGMHLVRGSVVLRITETEAYGDQDTASHAHRGQTPRNAPMFGPPGRAYVYLCYGVHHLLNIVCQKESEAAAVLIRGAEVLEGHAAVRRRRGGPLTPGSLAGPGKVGQALGLSVKWSGHPLLKPGGLELRSGTPPQIILCGERIGIGYSDERDQRRLWRFAVGGSTEVTHRRALKDLQDPPPKKDTYRTLS